MKSTSKVCAIEDSSAMYWSWNMILEALNCSLEEFNECEAIFVKRVVRKDSG